ncbi:MAG TPA: energy transducer TonB [Terriglobales bacterium]|nr:energy transducer TonB [Terriglobales bacterium]
MPIIPNSPQPQIVALNTFANSKASIVVAKPAAAVQTGAFGDPNGIAASNARKEAGIVQKGSFDSTGGAGPAGKTDGRVVMNAGFDKAAIGTGNGPSIHPAGAPRQANAKAGLPVEVTFKPKPKYTDEGRKQNISGEVCLEVRFKSDGRIDVLRVVRGLGYGLDEQAVKAAEQIKFKPALQEGQPVDSVALVHIIFELIS